MRESFRRDEISPTETRLERLISTLLFFLTREKKMNALHNAIALRYRQSVVVEKSTCVIPAIQMRGLLFDISQLGYTLSGGAMRAIRTLSETKFKEFHAMLISNLKEMVGANVKYNALFKNFPEDIPDDMEYLMKRIISSIYNVTGQTSSSMETLSCGHVIDPSMFNLDDFGACPICQYQVEELEDNENDRPPLEDITPLKVIGLVDDAEVVTIFQNLLAAKSSISAEDAVLIKELVAEDAMILHKVPAEIPMKENVAFIAGLAIKYTDNPSDVLLDHIKTATDVLRLAVQLNGGDISLKEPCKIKLNNKTRRLIMTLLDNVKNPEEDMLRYRMRWIRLAEVLHIGKYAKRYQNAFKACDTLRNEPELIETFNSEVEQLVYNINHYGTVQKQRELLALLVKRPGEYARRLDWMLRTFKSSVALEVVNTFKTLLGDLPTRMLLIISSHMTYRAVNGEIRYFLPKGSLAKMQVVPENRNMINQKYVSSITTSITNELLRRFSEKENLGNVFIDEDLKTCLVPFQQRSASKSLVTIARGSAVPLMETKAARMFIWWKNSEGQRIDVDLSAISYDKDWNYKNHISFTNLSDIGGVHSGDIQDAPRGASEFIDIDLATARSNGVRYVVMNVISYTGQMFDTFECFAGVMERDKVKSGKKFEARTVKNKFDLAGATRYNIPLILDLETNQMTWCDIALTSSSFSYVEGQSGNIVDMAKAIIAMTDERPNLFDLFWLHAEARADTIDYERVEGKEYDIEFTLDRATDADDILANWL